MMKTITAQSCAKINLSLDIVGVLPNGYHELRSVAHTIALHDTLRFTLEPASTWRLSCDDADLESEDNLCLRAARDWSHQAHENGGPKFGGVIELDKRIPYGAGLGGGSGNAWATLAALSRALDPHEKKVPRAQMLQMAKSLGADVPLFASGGALLMEGIGDIVSPLAPLAGWVVLAQPSARISTPQAYGAWDQAAIPSRHDTDVLLKVWKEEASGTERLRHAANHLGNDLREAARSLGVPVEAGIEALKRAGAMGAEMTGSGSAVFGVCADEEHAQQVEGGARHLLSGVPEFEADNWQLWSAPLCGYGVRFEGE